VLEEVEVMEGAFGLTTCAVVSMFRVLDLLKAVSGMKKNVKSS
jgi:hypothetical protein